MRHEIVQTAVDRRDPGGSGDAGVARFMHGRCGKLLVATASPDSFGCSEAGGGPIRDGDKGANAG